MLTYHEERHLDQWLNRTLTESDAAPLRARIISFCGENPDLTARKSWPEIRQLVERAAP